MACKKKYNTDVIIQVDTREQSTDYIKQIKIHKRRPKDGIKIIGTEIVTVKPKGVAKSTGDISYKYKFEDEEEWIQSNLNIEIKKKTDAFSSIYTKANYDRLIKEFERGIEAKLDM